MDIYSAPGSQVKFTNKDGHDYQREAAAKILDTETVYTVQRIDVGNWSSDVCLVGIPGCFNTVMFENVTSEEPMVCFVEMLNEEGERDQLVGFSLSFCIKDIIDGKVSADQVEMLFTNTAMTDWDVFSNAIEDYRLSYWRSNPELGIEIARRFWNEGRICQPRLSGHLHNGMGTKKWAKVITI